MAKRTITLTFLPSRTYKKILNVLIRYFFFSEIHVPLNNDIEESEEKLNGDYKSFVYLVTVWIKVLSYIDNIFLFSSTFLSGLVPPRLFGINTQLDNVY